MEPAERARNVADQITILADDMERDIKNAIALLRLMPAHNPIRYVRSLQTRRSARRATRRSRNVAKGRRKNARTRSAKWVSPMKQEENQ